jgi:hypothetical protein
MRAYIQTAVLFDAERFVQPVPACNIVSFRLARLNLRVLATDRSFSSACRRAACRRFAAPRPTAPTYVGGDCLLVLPGIAPQMSIPRVRSRKFRLGDRVGAFRCGGHHSPIATGIEESGFLPKRSRLSAMGSRCRCVEHFFGIVRKPQVSFSLRVGRDERFFLEKKTASKFLRGRAR